MQKIQHLAALAVLAAGVTVANADTMWNVDATFTYPSNKTTNLLTGTIELDPSFNIVTYDLTVTGNNTQADDTYTPGDSFRTLPEDTTHFDFYDPGTNQYITLYLNSPVTNSGGSIELLAGNDGANSNSTVVCPGCGVLDSGTMSTTAPVPEPFSLALLATVVGMVGIAGLRRRKAAASSL
jgi:hypothetical protein